MAALSITHLTIRPGRYEDLVEAIKQTRDIMGRHGAQSTHLYAGLIAGEASGTFLAVSVFEDMAGAGAGVQGFVSDPDGVQLMTDTLAPDGPTEDWSGSMWMEVPLD